MKPFSIIAAAIFLLMALAHLYRIAVGFPIMIGETGIGQAVSWAGLIVASVMAVGLFREGLRGNPHVIRLTAQMGAGNTISVTPNIHLPYNSGRHRFKFELDDRTGKNVQFAALTHEDNSSACPPDPLNPGAQIVDVSIENNPRPGEPRTAEFWNKNNQTRPRPMNVSYQWEFTCDSGATVQPFDPIIANGGRM